MTEEKWLEVSLTVDGEMAEAVAEVLARFAPNGVVVESNTILPEVEGEGRPVGPMRVTAYLPINAELEETRQRLEESLWYLGRIWPENPLPEAQYKTIQETNWMEAWKEHFKPIPVGNRLIIVPAWLESPMRDRLAIKIDPGMAFGTGAHPTTQLCLELLEDSIRGGEDVIDVGCGSGILSIGAIMLGAKHALGVDIDRQAVEVARETAELNGAADAIEFGIGSANEVRAGQFSLRQAPLVMANILAPVLVRLMGDGLDELPEPGGVLLLSGILLEQWEGKDGQPPGSPLKQMLLARGYEIFDVRQMGDWVAAAARRG